LPARKAFRRSPFSGVKKRVLCGGKGGDCEGGEEAVGEGEEGSEESHQLELGPVEPTTQTVQRRAVKQLDVTIA